MKSRTAKPAVFCVISAGICWGIISLFVKHLSSQGFDSMQIVFSRMVSAAIVLAAFLSIKDRTCFRIKLRDLWMFVGTGFVSTCLFNYCYFQSILLSEASVAVVLLYTAPAFVLLLSAVLFREKITAKKIVAVFLTVAGCAAVSDLLSIGYTVSLPALFFGIAAGFLYSLYSIFSRFALKKYAAGTITFYTFVFGAIGSMLITDVRGIFTAVCADSSTLIWILGIGSVCTVIPFFLYTLGLQTLEPGTAAVLVTVEPLVGALIGMVVYHENHSCFKLLGIALILASIIMLSVKSKSKTSAEDEG